MAGRGRVPKEQRRNLADVPIRGEWQSSPGVGWQFGAVPELPDGLMEASRTAWQTWMTSWIAAHWTPTDLPGLRQLIRLWDQVERGEFQRHTEMRLMMDTYGLTPKGQQDRRWAAPKAEEQTGASVTPVVDRYAHLKAVK